LRLFSFGGYGLALAALAPVVFGAYDSNPFLATWPLSVRAFAQILQNGELTNGAMAWGD